MTVLTKAQIKLAEENAVSGGTFSFRELMHTAGKSAFEEIVARYEITGKKIAVICGKGNNGGDGCVIADLLLSKGADVTLILPYGAPKTENANYYFEKLGGIKTLSSFEDKYDYIIDALFGIGFVGVPDKDITRLIESVNKSNAVKISVDIPSGVECDTGAVNGIAIKSDLTLTFISYKPCFVLPDGSDYCGEVKVIDIGVEVTDKTYEIIEKPKLKPRNHNCHKGTFGTALLICGSYGMAGALMLSAKACLRSGVGIAKCMMPKSIYAPVTSFIPEAVCVPLKEAKQGTLKFNKKALRKHIESADAVLFGCGIGNPKSNVKTLKYLLENYTKTLIIDADGINALSLSIDLLEKSKASVILTPHPGEMARLCGTTVAKIEENRPKFAKKIALRYKCHVVLKGSNTIVATPRGEISFNILGNSGMATGGTGDVLAGVITSLSAQGYSDKEAAEYGVYLHSLAGDNALKDKSPAALLPTDIIERL